MDATLPIAWEESPAHISDLEILTKMFDESVRAGRPLADIKARLAALGDQVGALVNQTPEKTADMLDAVLARSGTRRERRRSFRRHLRHRRIREPSPVHIRQRLPR